VSQPGRTRQLLRKTKMLLRRFSVVIFILLALLLVVLEKTDSPVIGGIRVTFLELILPVTNTLAKPVIWAGEQINVLSSYFSLADENAKLKAENQKLRQDHESLDYLLKENQQLAKMLNYQYPPDIKSVTAKIVADSEGAFAQSIIVLAGLDNGVEKGDVVMAEGALLGRVVNIASDAAQVLLLNDVNSRIPVFVGEHRENAILVGDNTASPSLIMFKDAGVIEVGDKVMTSGSAGVFPAGLMIGVVSEIVDDKVKVSLVVDRDKIDYVKILNFGQRSVLQNADKWNK